MSDFEEVFEDIEECAEKHVNGKVSNNFDADNVESYNIDAFKNMGMTMGVCDNYLVIV